MSRKNRERVQRIQAGVEKPRATPTDPTHKAQHGLCPFPGCSGRPLRGESVHGFCFVHEKFVSDLLFILPRIRIQQSAVPTDLVLPGQPGFALAKRK
jgi:hypothetical protein